MDLVVGQHVNLSGGQRSEFEPQNAVLQSIDRRPFHQGAFSEPHLHRGRRIDLEMDGIEIGILCIAIDRSAFNRDFRRIGNREGIGLHLESVFERRIVRLFLENNARSVVRKIGIIRIRRVGDRPSIVKFDDELYGFERFGVIESQRYRPLLILHGCRYCFLANGCFDGFKRFGRDLFIPGINSGRRCRRCVIRTGKHCNRCERKQQCGCFLGEVKIFHNNII